MGRAGNTAAHGLLITVTPFLILGLEITVRLTRLAVQGPTVVIDSANAAV